MQLKLSRWKVLTVAGVLTLSYAVSVKAAQIKVSEDTFADLGFWAKVRYVNLDDRAKKEGATISSPDYRRNIFDVVDARFNIEGQVNRLIQFYGEVVSSGAYDSGVYEAAGIYDRDSKTRFSEGGINLVFMPELQLRLGKVRIPFTRDQQEDRYSTIVQTDWIYDPQGLFAYWRDGLLRNAEGGAVLHGEIAKGMLRYDLGIFNQASDDEPFNGVAWSVRVEFTPTMLGFKPETKTSARGWLKDTYLGKKGDILTIGIGYFRQNVATDYYTLTGLVEGGALLPGESVFIGDYKDLKDQGLAKELNVKAYTIDVFFEKRLGPGVFNLEGAYVYFEDSHLAWKFDGGSLVGVKKESSYYWYLQGQALYDSVVGIGKPAVYVKYEYLNADKVYSNPSEDIYGKDLEFNRWGVGINYYIKGNAARLTAGIDKVNYDKGAAKALKFAGLEDDATDYYVQAQIMF